MSKSERKSDRRSRKTGSVCETRWVLRGRNSKVSEGEKEKWQAKDATEVEVFRKKQEGTLILHPVVPSIVGGVILFFTKLRIQSLTCSV